MTDAAPGARSRAWIAAFVITVIASLLGGAQARANQLLTITIPDRHGEIPSQWLSYPGPPRAAVLLPDGYTPRRRYPLVLNLGGLGGNYATSAFGTGLHLNAIMVTPEPGSGWYTNWWNGGRRGAPAWESYYLDEVLPAILSRYRILPQRRYHAIIGISMGGLGATYLGGRLPGFFGSVASLSGFVDPQYFAPLTGEGMGLTSLAPLHGDLVPYPVYGPPDGFNAAGHNPVNLVTNLAHTRVFESTGTGAPSPAGLKDPGVVPVGSLLEGLIIYPMNQLYHRALIAAGIDVTYQVHTGGHDAPDGAAEVAAMLVWGLFKPVVIHPSSWVNDTVATSGRLWDIGYRFAQPPDAVVRFRRTGSSLAISAAGSAVTITSNGGCAITTETPAALRLARHGCHPGPAPSFRRWRSRR